MPVFGQTTKINCYNKGIDLAEQGKYDEAIQAYDRVIEINSQDANAWYNKGVILNIKGKYDQSLQASYKAIEINPQFTEAWNNIGNAFYNQGKYAEAIKHMIELSRSILNWRKPGATKVMH